MQDSMPKFETSGWYFFGYDLEKTDPEFQQLLAKYKVNADFRDYRGRSAVFVDNCFRIDSIRKRLWGHRWAIHSDWLNENPDLKDFDPRRSPPLGPRCLARKKKNG